MNEEILIELGEVSEKTMAKPGCIFESVVLPGREEIDPEECP